MNILLTGSSGLIGTALTQYLSSMGHSIYPLYRNPATTKTHFWFPEKNHVHLDDDINLDVVIHLAGENIADSRWDQKKKEAILNSRVRGTEIISKAIAGLKHKPSLFISGSAIGFYGETGANTVDETEPRGEGFLSDVAVSWEAATRAAEDAAIRTIHIRTGIVLSPHGGVLKKMLLPFKMGLGGTIGSGAQYMSWISINDVVRIINEMINNTEMSGAYNLVSENPATNRSFTKSLGKALHRPTLFPMPAFMVKILFGEMGDDLLLSSTRVLPARLKSSGYVFTHANLEQALAGLLEK
jgi:uncharacterized protein (TIGR01777 family)